MIWFVKKKPISAFSLSASSLERLKGVHPDLIGVVKRAIEITAMDFIVTEGLRTPERQRKLVAEKKSKTMYSRHLTGHAVDLAACPGGIISWHSKDYPPIRDAMFSAAKEFGVPLRWGGDWNSNGTSADESFLDMPHFEIPR